MEKAQLLLRLPREVQQDHRDVIAGVLVAGTTDDDAAAIHHAVVGRAERQVHFGYYIPDGEPRFIPDGAFIHESAVLRMDAMPGYRPVNLPKQFEKFPMPAPPMHASAEPEEET